MNQNGILIIIGSGISGISAAVAARQNYPHAGITVISKDPDGFYNRIALNSFVTGKRTREQLFFNKSTWLKEQRIELLTATIQHIEADNKTLQLKSGNVLKYDRLILATGVVPALPPVKGLDTDGVHTLWTLEQAKELKNRLKQSRSVAIIGGGVLGVETALDFKEAGKAVTIIESSKTVLPLQLTPASAEIMTGLLTTSKDINIQTSTRAESIIPKAGQLQVKLDNGQSITVDTVLMCTGVKPDTALAQTAGIAVNKGIVVNSFMETDKSGILACGNGCELDDRLQFLWNPAMHSGITAGQNAFDRKKEFVSTTVPVHLKSSGLPLFTIGSPADINPSDTVITRISQTA